MRTLALTALLGLVLGAAGSAEATIITETWTGTDGAGWPAQWTQQDVTGSLVATIQSDEGEIARVTGNGKALLYINSTAAEEVDQLVWLNISDNNACAGFIARRQDSDSDTFYLLELSNANSAISKYVDGSRTALASIDNIAAGTNYWVRFLVESGVGETNLRMKLWAAGGGEPAGWTAQVADSEAALQNVPGRFGLWGDMGGADRSAHYDDYWASVVPEPATAALLVLGGLAVLTWKRR